VCVRFVFLCVYLFVCGVCARCVRVGVGVYGVCGLCVCVYIFFIFVFEWMCLCVFVWCVSFVCQCAVQSSVCVFVICVCMLCMRFYLFLERV